MLNQARKIPPMNLQIFAEGNTDDGSDMFLEAEQTSAAEGTTEKETGTDPETAPTEQEAPAEQDKAGTEKAEPSKDTATIRVKYNGKEMDVPMPEATVFIQKGMNYDKVAGQLEELKKSLDTDTIREIDQLATESGMSRQDFLKSLSTARQQLYVNKALEEIREKYPDMPDEAAMELAERRAAEKKQQEADTASKTKEAAEAEKLKPWQDFVAEYKITDASQLPKDVIDAITAGTPPVTAMLRHEKAELEKRVAELEGKSATEAKNKENKEKSIGSAASKGAAETVDPFWVGFNS